MPFPDRLDDVKRLIAQHRQIEKQTLMLALYYARADDPQGVYLLEVISPFGHNEVSDDRELFEMEYGSTPGFTLPDGSRLHILLTNVVEGTVAVEERWPALIPVLEAMRQGRYLVLHQEREGNNMLAALQGERVAA